MRLFCVCAYNAQMYEKLPSAIKKTFLRAPAQGESPNGCNARNCEAGAVVQPAVGYCWRGEVGFWRQAKKSAMAWSTGV